MDLAAIGDQCDAARAAQHGQRDAAAEHAAAGSMGYVHSYEAGSAVDGPGVRFVMWTTGCQFRCQYCHNPDTWHLRNGTPMTLDQVMHEIRKYRQFMKVTRGGVTVSGGEPLVQAPFVRQVFRQCKALGIHTALDTNGALGDRLSDEDLADIDLVLLDIKSWDAATHRNVTQHDVAPVLRFAQRLSALGRPTWLRFVLVPGLTDSPANVEGIAQFAASLRSLERVEVLPFHQLGGFKWQQLGVAYPLAHTAPPTPELLARVTGQFRAHGLTTFPV
jgi:pyruvate formate lyase activating enzyme